MSKQYTTTTTYPEQDAVRGFANPVYNQPQAGYSEPQAYPPSYQPPSYQPPKPEDCAPDPYASDVAINDGGPALTDPFGDFAVRQGFVRKVFGILSLMLLFTTAVISLFMYSEGIQSYCYENVWPLATSMVIYFATAITLICCKSLRRQHPHNVILLSVFTFATSFMLGVVCSMYTVESVALAGGITTITCLAVAVFAMTTNLDFTKCYGILIGLLWVFILTGFLFLIPMKTEATYKIYAGLGAALFVFILIVDIQLIVGGKRMAISPEEYVFAALQVYLDIINIFLKILAIVGERK